MGKDIQYYSVIISICDFTLILLLGTQFFSSIPFDSIHELDPAGTISDLICVSILRLSVLLYIVKIINKADKRTLKAISTHFGEF